jgi:DNA-binding HxlR family transcriptional regulator
VLWDVCFGWNRFDEIHDHLGIARNILKGILIEDDMVDRIRYQERPNRFEYVPTTKTLDFVPALLAVVAWGDRWTAIDGPPIVFTHRSCGHDTVAKVVCSECSSELERDLDFRRGPGLSSTADYRRTV